MCGIAGFLRLGSPSNEGEWEAILSAMGDALRHRGPDDEGIWLDRQCGIGLSHRRLSVVDLSPAGHQPMSSASGRYVIVFNGEIYNHELLRAEIRSLYPGDWRGHSDTETLLACIDLWGVEKTLGRLTGMFAFALWDKQEHELMLARDRLGEKPLYYGWQGDSFLFASELKAMKVHPAFVGNIDRQALGALMQFGVIPAPQSIYQGIRKLLPGTWLKVSLTNRDTTAQHYWNARSVITRGLARPFAGSPDEAVETLHGLLLGAVRKQMIADVPIGALLSGGIDSSTIVALAQAQNSRPVKTFTIGFRESGYNEAEFARAVAAHLGTEHTELYVSPQQALEVIPQLPQLYCEPFADSSQIPTFLVSQLARSKVTVALSGDGGDELFGGYTRYLMGQRIWNTIRFLPAGPRRLLSALITSVSPESWNRVIGPMRMVIPKRMEQINFGDKLHKATGALSAASAAELYRLLTNQWPDPGELVIGLDARTGKTHVSGDHELDMDFIHWMMAEDTLGYLPNDILTKVDRAAMGVSLETRIPLLDHEILEFAWSLPLEYKVRNGVGKWPLRQVLEKYIPRNLIERPKMGFGIPIDSWLRGPLREWAEALISESRLKSDGYLDPVPIRRKWLEHQSGARNWQSQLWNVLMFQAWLQENH